MTTEQLSQLELKNQTQRSELIKSKIFFSYDELDAMSQEDRINAIMRMKQDETMKWQRLASQLHYYLMVASLVLAGVGLLVLLTNLDKL